MRRSRMARRHRGERSLGAGTILSFGCGELLRVRGLQLHFPIHQGLLQRARDHVRAVDGVDFSLHAGRTLALVGESGCGKTSTGKAVLQLVRPTAGSVCFEGVELTQLRGTALRARRAQMQMVFQDAYSSMNPRMSVGRIIEEGMIVQRIERSRRARRARVSELLERVGLRPELCDRHPHELSGGQRQRVCIARALAVNPRLIVCDEPTSALDVSVQAQILNLLQRLQQELQLSYLFITHDLAVVGWFAHEVAVMYLGRIVEQGPVEEVLREPLHPYTRALLAALPVLDPQHRRSAPRPQGDLPSPCAHPRAVIFIRAAHRRCRCAASATPSSVGTVNRTARVVSCTPDTVAHRVRVALASSAAPRAARLPLAARRAIIPASPRRCPRASRERSRNRGASRMSRYLNLSKAARLLGITRTALQEEIRSGKIDTFEGKIDLAELLRAYPQVQVERSAMVERAQQIKDHALTRYSAETLSNDTTVLQAQVGLLQRELTTANLQLRWYVETLEQMMGKLEEAQQETGGETRIVLASISTWLRYKLDN